MNGCIKEHMTRGMNGSEISGWDVRCTGGRWWWWLSSASCKPPVVVVVVILFSIMSYSSFCHESSPESFHQSSSLFWTMSIILSVASDTTLVLKYWGTLRKKERLQFWHFLVLFSSSSRRIFLTMSTKRIESVKDAPSPPHVLLYSHHVFLNPPPFRTFLLIHMSASTKLTPEIESLT